MVEKQLIDKVESIRTTLNEISVYNLDVKTSLELYYELARKVNEVITELTRFEGVVSEEVVKQNEKLLYLLGEGLKEQVGIKIDELITNGTIQDLINNKIFSDLNTKIETYKQQTDEQFNTIEKNERMLTKNKQIIAHRGCWLFSPENTLESIYDAKKYGYNFVELDINKTYDGEYILMHDTTVDRTTNGTGAVTSLTLSYIQSLIIDSGVYDKEHTYTVPTFEEAVKLCSELELGINLDCSKIWFNEQTINEVVFILQKYSMFEKTFFVISDNNARELLTTIYPNTYVTWLNNDTNLSVAISEVKKYKNAFISYNISDITQAMVYEFNRYDVKFFIYGCNSDEFYEKALTYNPTFIETDYCMVKKNEVI